nr:MAG TPA: hypothetical protein [Caudoviricetes sp.]
MRGKNFTHLKILKKSSLTWFNRDWGGGYTTPQKIKTE